MKARCGLLALAFVFLSIASQNNSYIEAKAEETISLNKSDFTLNVNYEEKQYTLTLDFASEEIKSRYQDYVLNYSIYVEETEYNSNTCTFMDTEENNYVYAVNFKIYIENSSESINFTKYLQNGREVIVSAIEEDTNDDNFKLLPYFYLPIIAVFLGIGYFIFFKANKFVGSLESTAEKLEKLLKFRSKFDLVLNNEKLNEEKKKKQILKLFFKVRGHLYSIRYIIENMSIDNSIDNTELLDECNAVVNNINMINVKNESLEGLTKKVDTLFNNDILQLLNLSKRMLNIQKKYLESTYGKK